MGTDNRALAYVCYTKKENIRMNSSSGGVFYELAKHMIEQENAVIYGAAFAEDFSVRHMRIDRMDDVEKLMRSKYVQSDMGDNFLKVKEDLSCGNKVMFAGTPCQVKGLIKFLEASNIATENLFTVDFVCHGVPSPKVWKEYLNKLSSKCNSKITDVNFRAKRCGWHDYYMKVSFEKGEYAKSHYIDEYMFYYLSDYIMRDSCYECPLRKAESKAGDITIADSWQSKRESKKMDKGKSLIIVNTEKGESAFEKISSNMEVMKREVPIEDGVIANCQEKIKAKDRFFEDYLKFGFSGDLKKKYYCGKSLTKNRIKHFLYKTGLANRIG